MMAPVVSKSGIGTTLPTISLLIAAFISGLYWLPLRQVERAGISGLWATMAIAVIAGIPLLLPLLRRRSISDWRDLALIGILVGGAYAFYAASLMLTEVVRAVLLFYIAPVWSTALEILVLHQTLTRRRIASLVLGLAGLIVILSAGADFSSIFSVMNAGDALALASGLSWSIGLLVIFRRSDLPTSDQIAGQAAGAVLVALAVGAIGLTGTPPPSLDTMLGALPWVLFVALLLTVPLWCLSLWASRHLPPARATLLFMIEVCVGIGSAAILSGQPFGWHEAMGTLLVLAAAGVELISNRVPSPQPVS
jgi:drug/metabolite transporter (DMT)-like permease